MAAARTMFEKIWQRHVVVDRDDGYTLLYIDRHLMHDGSAAGFAKLRERNMKLRRPDRGFATPDHYVRSDSRAVGDIADPHHRKLVEQLDLGAMNQEDPTLRDQVGDKLNLFRR